MGEPERRRRPPRRLAQRPDDRRPAPRAPRARSAAGCLTARHSRREPAAIAPQKKSVVRVPSTPPPGTARLRSRQACDQVMGAVHCVFRLGPVGPLKKAGCCSPQRPWNPIHGNCEPAAAESLGIVRTAGRHRGPARACRRSRRPARRMRPGTAPSRRSSHASRRPGRQPDASRRPSELGVVPVRLLAALVLAVADPHGVRASAWRGVVGVEVELDHLPVALVQVVPVVVDVEDPVLQRELAG